VLVVEDDGDTRDLIAATLEGCGARVDCACSVREALAALDRVRPDVLVSDISMPHEDGYALVRAVRARDPELGGRVPALALTNLCHADQRIDALLAGFQMHMAKPFEPSKLVAAVESLARREKELPT
jgi:CheY-like chemotaxis protein